MSTSHQRLHDYPALAKWYDENQAPPPAPAEGLKHTVWQICHALLHDGRPMITHWQSAFQRLLANTNNAEKDFIELEQTLASGGLDIFAMATEIAEVAIMDSYGHEYRQLMSQLADETGLAVFRFIAAWTALNNDDSDTCIEECEKVEIPVASIHTLHGQALLERGDALDAIEVLNIAIELAPTELLALFQLAKAHHVLNNFEEAWKRMMDCDQLEPDNEEIVSFLAIIASTADPVQSSWLEVAYEKLVKSFQQDTKSSAKFIMLCELAFKLESEQRFETVIATADMPTLSKDPQILTQTAWILKSLDAQKWVQAAETFLTQMVTAPDTQTKAT